MGKLSSSKAEGQASNPELPPRSKAPTATPAVNIIPELTNVYMNKIKPLEDLYSFPSFLNSQSLSAADVGAKPMILLMGQYSVGKTTFIKHLLGREYPGAHIGPEPTTDRFIAIMDGPERSIPGNAAAVNNELPFTALSKFGVSFLNKFQVAQVPAAALDNIILIDTPGILSGEKQRLGRAYDFSQLDISDEFKEAIMTLRGHDDKIRVVLNKADTVNGQQLMRVYGALMWSLGKVLQTPEVVRVYISSFWDQPFQYKDCEILLSAEKQDLFKDLKNLPRNTSIRKINEMVKRARLVQVHSLIIAHLRHELPNFFGKGTKQADLVNNLEAEFQKIQRVHQLAPGDFPDPDRYRQKLADFKLSKFPKLDKKMMQLAMDALSSDLPRLMSMIPEAPQILPSHIQNPFEAISDEAIASPNDRPPESELYDYELIEKRASYVERFRALVGSGGDRIAGPALKGEFEATGLDKATLAKIWGLADWTKDGYLDTDEFVVAMHLCEIKKKGWVESLPATLPEALKPKRQF
ncbi:P-loop containing nucleoside triphosphate hydrolase protein [Entophlyctis helioformis]|nr:P-loop containing nucleoside triphosphate hydrolase protein [Entophlyctis helioformis]